MTFIGDRDLYARRASKLGIIKADLVRCLKIAQFVHSSAAVARNDHGPEKVNQNVP